MLNELERVVDMLTDNPEIGRLYSRGGLQNIRCLRLRKTPYMIYYQYEPGGDVATIVSAWSAVRKQRPPI